MTNAGYISLLVTQLLEFITLFAVFIFTANSYYQEALVLFRCAIRTKNTILIAVAAGAFTHLI